MSMFASNVLLWGRVRVRVWKIKRSKGTTKPLMANLDINLSIQKNIPYTVGTVLIA